MKRYLASFLFIVLGCFGHSKIKAVDPGPRTGVVSAGKPIAGLSLDQIRFFRDGQQRFSHSEGVGNGLGPGFNSDSCGSCHSQPAVGGTSPNLKAFPFVGANPQVAIATANGAKNVIPFFVTADGPVREARFKSDGGVHDLFSIEGRADASGCIFPQPDFKTAAKLNNLIFRIPTPVFGGGLIESISDETIVANQFEDAARKNSLGIHGVPNRSGNTGNITRFGWKAQNPSLLVFSSEAYNVEIGETNQGFPQKRGNPPVNCIFNPLPEDQTNIVSSDPVAVPSDDDQFSTFMRFLDQPSTAVDTPSTVHGRQVFYEVGCNLCHTPTLVTGSSSFAGSLSNVRANLYSDLLVHRMGKKLADGITQGNAGPDQFRSAPLWGVGQRVFFLHDGRTSDLVTAIEDHKSSGSEANKVIRNLEKKPFKDQQDLINFLRSL